MTFTTRRPVLALLLMAGTGAFVATGPARALELDGARFDDSVRLGDRTLVLNGAGFRQVAWFKGYAAGLYLVDKVTSEAAAVDAPGPKRLQMRMMVDVGTEEFVKAIDKGFGRNTPEAEQPALADRRKQWNDAILAIGKVKKGDRIDLDYLPPQGMTMRLNGNVVGTVVPGADFYGAMLRIFIGQKPVDANLKAGLLGRRASG